MIHRIVGKQTTRWAREAGCPVKGQLDYMRSAGALRPVQISAIETYLYLKIVCGPRPLWRLFAEGRFNGKAGTTSAPLPMMLKEYFAAHPETQALWELASQPAVKGKGSFVPALKAALEAAPEEIDAAAVFKQLFYGVDYPDWLFSLPMGAGKTFLMAAFIYLDLAFALEDPENPAFARNFIVLAPSGLKSAITPSLRTIQEFDPRWVVAEPLASQLKREMNFVVLDAESSANRSNRTRNPNVQKLSYSQQVSDFGLVAVTNAEKEILDCYDDENTELPLKFSRTEEQRYAAANELRAIIGKIPSLSIFVDEAHHAAASEIKLRSVISKWAVAGSVNSVLGFSGTPYLASAERVAAKQGLELKTAEIANTVHYFPLVDGVGAFLKRPAVEIVRDAPDSLSIVRRGIASFLERFKTRRYANGAAAKLAIYCGTIARLEEDIYPLAAAMLAEAGIDANDAILKYHRGNKDYPAPADAELAFATLDTPHSAVRIVLLVQIGKEGWDCRSLAGVVLSQEGDFPANMVLQTSCRCLREVSPGGRDEALIVLNEKNGALLADQLKKQHHATLAEFQRGAMPSRIERFDRTKRLALPDIPFFQMRVEYGTETVADSAPAAERLRALLADLPALRRRETVTTGDFENLERTKEAMSHAESQRDRGAEIWCPFGDWLDLLQKESFNFWRKANCTSEELELLREIHSCLCASATSAPLRENNCILSPEYDQQSIRSRAITAFWPRRRLVVKEEIVEDTARLLVVERLVSPLDVPDAQTDAFVPSQEVCNMIAEADAKGFAIAKSDRTWHYLPYRTDSGFERAFLEEVLKRQEFLSRDLEIYYNGDSSLTEFRIRCYRRDTSGAWVGVGDYTPDFLIIRRDPSRQRIESCLVVETKGRLYANDPAFADRRAFAEGRFTERNKAPRPGFPRFQYLYLQEAPPWQNTLVDTFAAFFDRKEESV